MSDAHHRHDHDGAHDHAPDRAVTPAARSLLRASASMRLLGAAAFIAFVWLAVVGAMA